MGSNHQKGTIQWILSQVPAAAEQPDPNKRPFKQPRLVPVRQQHPCDPQLTLRYAQHHPVPCSSQQQLARLKPHTVCSSCHAAPSICDVGIKKAFSLQLLLQVR